MKTDKTTDTSAPLDTRPWYGLSKIKRVKLPKGGSAYELDGDSFCCLGPDLLAGFLAEEKAVPFPRGDYILGCWDPGSQTGLPDWGSLRVHGPGSWVMRSRDGRQIWAAGRGGQVFCLRGGGA